MQQAAGDSLNKAPLDHRLDQSRPAPTNAERTADAVEVALANAIEAEVQDRQPGWEGRVALLAGELQSRRRAREGVATLPANARQRSK